MRPKKNKRSKLYNKYKLGYSPLTNYGIEEDADDPKEQAHLDYKYLRSFEGPLAKPSSQKAESDHEKEKLLKKKNNPPKPIFSIERKKFGGIRMCQRCLRTKVTILLSKLLLA